LKVPRPIEDARTYADHVTELRPIAYWRLGEASGTTAVDATGNGYDGTYTNTPTLGVAGALTDDTDTAVEFASGSSEYVNVAYDAALNPATFTVSAWFRTSSAADQSLVGTQYSTAGNFTGYNAYVSSSGFVTVQFGENDATKVTLADATDTADGAWHLAAWTYDGTTARLFVDGVQVDSDTPSFVANGVSPLRIAATGNSTASTWDGALDEVSLHGYALSADEVAALYATGQGTFTTRTVDPDATYADYCVDTLGAVAHWRLNEASGSTFAAWKTSEAFDAAITGTPTLGVAGALAESADTAATFDGSSDYATVPYAAALNPTSAFAISGWVKPGTTASGDYDIVELRDGASNVTYIVRQVGARLHAYVGGTGASHNVQTASDVLAVGEWTHWAFAFDGTTASLYVNGVLKDSDTPSSPTFATSNAVLTFGRSGASAARYFDGDIQAVTLYDKALTATEIANLYTLGSTGYLESDMTNYERTTCRVVEPIRFEDLDGPLRQSFMVALRASDPRIYDDVETVTEDTSVSSNTWSASVSNSGTVETPCTVKVEDADASEFGLSVSQSGSSHAGLSIDAEVDITDPGYIEADGDARTVSMQLPSIGEVISNYSGTLHAHYRFDDASGAPQDSSGNGYHLAVDSGSPTYQQTGLFPNDANTALELSSGSNIVVDTASSSLNALWPSSPGERIFAAFAVENNGSNVVRFKWYRSSNAGFYVDLYDASANGFRVIGGSTQFFSAGSMDLDGNTVVVAMEAAYRTSTTSDVTLTFYNSSGATIGTSTFECDAVDSTSDMGFESSASANATIDELAITDGDLSLSMVGQLTGGAPSAFANLTGLIGWPYLKVGSNTVTATAGDTATQGTLTVTHRNARI